VREQSELLVAVETAADVSSGLADVVRLLSRAAAGEAVEWWQEDGDGRTSTRRQAAGAQRPGRRTVVSLGPLGVLLVGETTASELMPAITALVPALRRRFESEQLIERTCDLARRNEALQDFAALVAHEVKRPLLAGMLMNDVERGVTTALELVDALLEAARVDPCGDTASAADCLGEALRQLGPIPARVSSELPGGAPISATALRLVLRNLIANAVAAGAREIEVRAAQAVSPWTLTVDDDGVGLDADGYASGSGLGLNLTRRFVSRLGATLELAPRAPTGTRATLAFEEGR